MKEALKKARANFISATTGLIKTIVDIVDEKGDKGFTFGEFNRPTVIDDDYPVDIDAIRINDGSFQVKVVGHDEWIPFSFDAGEDALVATEEYISACMIRELDQ